MQKNERTYSIPSEKCEEENMNMRTTQVKTASYLSETDKSHIGLMSRVFANRSEDQVESYLRLKKGTWFGLA